MFVSQNTNLKTPDPPRLYTCCAESWAGRHLKSFSIATKTLMPFHFFISRYSVRSGIRSGKPCCDAAAAAAALPAAPALVYEAAPPPKCAGVRCAALKRWQPSR